MKKNINQIVTTVVFLVFIFAFTIATLVAPKRTFSENENRSLAQAPEVSVKSIFDGSFSKNYETYLTDQFVLRDGWIAVKTMAEMALLKKDINDVYLAEDNYLIEMHSDDTINKEQAYKNADRLAQFIEMYSKELGDDKVKAMIVPTAVITLKDKLPAFATTYDQNSLIDYIGEKTGDNFIDVRNVFENNKEDYLYYKTDHHWTMYGAYYAYGQWAEEMGIKPYKMEDFNQVSTDGFKGTIYSKLNFAFEDDTVTYFEAKFPIEYTVRYEDEETTHNTMFVTSHLTKKDMYPVYLDGNHAVVTIDTNVNNGRKLLVIKDSYAHCFATLAANHYETTYMVDFRYFRASIDEFIEKNEITDILVLYNGIHFSTDKNTMLFLK